MRITTSRRAGALILGLCLTTGCGAAAPSETTQGAGGAPTTDTTTSTSGVGGGGGGDALCGFSASYGDAYTQSLTSADVDATGAIVLAGAYDGTIDFGDQVLDSGSTDGGPLVGGAVFLARLDPQGNTLWSKSFGAADDDRTVNTAVDAQGDIFLATTATEPIDLGDGELTPGGSFDAFLAKIGPDGETLWSRRALDAPGVDGGASVIGLRTDGQGDVIVVGMVDGDLHRSLYLTKIDPSGEDLWGTMIVADQGGLFTDGDQAIAVDGEGGVTLLAGVWALSPDGSDTTIDLGDGPLTVPADGNNAIVARFDTDGALVYARLMDRLGGAGNDWAESGPIVAGRNGEVYLSATFGGTVDLGNGPLTATPGGSMYVAKLDPAGNTLWSRAFGDQAYASGMALSRDGRLVLGGGIDGSIDLGGGPLVNDDTNTDIFIGALEAATGAPLMGRRYGSGLGVILSIGLQPNGVDRGGGRADRGARSLRERDLERRAGGRVRGPVRAVMGPLTPSRGA